MSKRIDKMATAQLIKEALENATPAQLIRVRAAISSDLNDGGSYDLWGYKSRAVAALRAFDEKRYDAKEIATVLSDKALGEALC